MAFEQRLKENSVSEAWANYWIFPNDIAKLKISPTILSFLAWDNIYLIGSPQPKSGSGIVIFSKTRSHLQEFPLTQTETFPSKKLYVRDLKTLSLLLSFNEK